MDESSVFSLEQKIEETKSELWQIQEVRAAQWQAHEVEMVEEERIISSKRELFHMLLHSSASTSIDGYMEHLLKCNSGNETCMIELQMMTVLLRLTHQVAMLEHQIEILKDKTRPSHPHNVVLDQVAQLQDDRAALEAKYWTHGSIQIQTLDAENGQYEHTLLKQNMVLQNLKSILAMRKEIISNCTAIASSQNSSGSKLSSMRYDTIYQFHYDASQKMPSILELSRNEARTTAGCSSSSSRADLWNGSMQLLLELDGSFVVHPDELLNYDDLLARPE